jgi:hypothetical protein
MTDTLKDIAGRAVAALSEQEHRQSAVYLDPNLLDTGATVSIRGATLPVTAPGFMAFVDLEPASNWSHACRYLLVDRQGGAIASVDARFPPAAESLRLIHRGAKVEDWMLLTTQPLQDE